MTAKKTSMTVVSLLLAGLAFGATADSAKAECHGSYGGYGYSYGPSYYYAPAPVYAAPPVYAPPVYYYSAPTYYAPRYYPSYSYGGYYPRHHRHHGSFSFGFGY